MNTLKNTRRRFLQFAPLAWLFGVGRRTSATHDVARQIAPEGLVAGRPAGETLEEWLEHSLHQLPRLASGLADMERRGVQYEQPAEWFRLNYVGAIPWRPGVVMLYGFGRRSEAEASAAAVDAWLDAAGIPVIGLGWSEDMRAFTRFAIADREAVAPLVKESLASLTDIAGEMPRRTRARV